MTALEQPSAAAIFRTSDGGLTWVRIPLPADIAFYRLHFLDAHIGVALHAESESRQVVYRTIDAGQTWIKVASLNQANDGHLVDLAATSPTDVFVVGEGSLGRGYVAQLLGKSGTLCVRDDLPVDLTENSSNALGIFGDGTGHLWIVGKEMILHSADNGKTWENQYSNSDHWIDLADSGFALPGGHAWITVANFEIFRTEDYGKHWQRALTTSNQDDVNFQSISFSSPEKGCALSNSAFIYCTRDGGTWSKTKAFPNDTTDSGRPRLFLFPSSHGWASFNGALYKTMDEGQSFAQVLTSCGKIAAHGSPLQRSSLQRSSPQPASPALELCAPSVSNQP